MGKNQSASNLTNIIKQDASGNITFVSGSTTLMSVSSSGAITTTGNVAGTASYASNAELLDGLDSTVFTLTSSFAAQTASFTAFTASQNILNGKYATTGSNTFAGIQTVNSNLIVTGSITAQTLVVQTITSSVDFVTGSTRFGSLAANTHTFTGSVLVSGSQTISNGDLTISGNRNIYLSNSNPAAGVIRFYNATSGSTKSAIGSYFNTADEGNLEFLTGGTTTKMIITSVGNVGIGTTAPTANLTIYNATVPYMNLKNASSGTYGMVFGFADSAGNAELWNYDNGYIRFATNGTERMRITSAGGVALTGNGNLDINPASGNANISMRSGNTYEGYISAITEGGILFGTGASATERMRIQSGGRVLINTTSTSPAGMSTGLFQVNSEVFSVGSVAGLFWENRSGGVTNNSNWYGFYTTAGTIYLYGGANNIASINSSTGAYTALSDINKKKDFEPYTNNGLNAILGLKPTLYRMKDEDESTDKHLGFIAQEVKDYIPQAYVETIAEEKDGGVHIGLNYQAITTTLVKAIQELKAEIDELKNR